MPSSVNRSTVRSALALALALTLGAGAGAGAGPTGQALAAMQAVDSVDAVDGHAYGKPPTTGRFITSTGRGVVLVNENGRFQHTLIDARGQKPDIVAMHANSGVFLWSSDKARRTTWHIANLYGGELGTFRVPSGSSTPTVDTGGYTVYWVRPGTATSGAQLMSLEINDPQARPEVLRDLGPGTGQGLSVSPDFQWISVVLDTATGRQIQVLSRDGLESRLIPTPTGTTILSPTALWAPDSGRVAFVAGAAATTGTAYVAPIALDYAPINLGVVVQGILDFSPDSATLLTASPTSDDLVGISATTGAVTGSYPIDRSSGTDVFWSGLKRGAIPSDRTAPSLKVTEPRSSQPRAWSTIRGKVSDRGGSLLRYVVIAAFQKRGDSWWALVGDGKHPTWRTYPTRNEARYTAKERRAKIIDATWRLDIPALTAGSLVLVVKAADGAGNNKQHDLSATLG